MKYGEKQKIAGMILVLAGLMIFALSGLEMTVEERTNKYRTSVSVYSLDNNSSSVKVGVNAGRNLNFGRVPEGTNVTKKIRVSTSAPSKVSIQASGNISKYLEYPKKVMVEGKKTIRIKINPESSGNFSGTLTMEIKVPNGEIGKKWMKIRSQF
ncbi:MAG: hypothetical protein ABEK10_00550 [Candidatus Nanosalina sp.]